MDWQPIESYGKNTDHPQGVLLFRPSAPHWLRIAPGHWNEQAFHKKPKPYWDSALRAVCVFDCRIHPPTHWMPLPDPPEQSQRQERVNG